MLERALENEEAAKSQLEEIDKHNKRLETHLIEVRMMVQAQQELPSQVLLRRPVILIDAFEENRFPFHLEFINSFEALFAVFMVRFKDKGAFAVDRLRRRMFVMYEQSKQKQIDMAGPWSKAFKVSALILSLRRRILMGALAGSTRRHEHAHLSISKAIKDLLSGLRKQKEGKLEGR
jgi:hypothetical protein